ncbi:hypothetical protein Hamer_G026550 [Homarus americanus]|uniref:Uncharacterized protein n=1 Tax=Homarus americanus TaxID=6706 RepID=A0A8J5JJP1_HOMAM|nr:hypothetical protein Hamer_G026550 [Homarus americanus]
MLSGCVIIDVEEEVEERELRVLDYELKSLKADKRVYLQQPNSNIYFLCKKADALTYLEQEREALSVKQKSS